MRSITKQDPSIPEVYCQSGSQTDSLCSLMSAVLQRDVRSKRFDRNEQRGGVSVQQLSQYQGVTVYTPQMNTNSLNVTTTLVVIETHDLVDMIARIATNRGYRVICIPQVSHWSQVSGPLAELSDENSKLFLCSNINSWLCEDIISALASTNGAYMNRIKGIVLFESKGMLSHGRIVQQTTIPTIFVTASRHSVVKLLPATSRDPFLILVKFPDDNLLNERSLIEWQCRFFVEFVEAEGTRLSHSFARAKL